jgi:hypothetical protein
LPSFASGKNSQNITKESNDIDSEQRLWVAGSEDDGEVGSWFGSSLFQASAKTVGIGVEEAWQRGSQFVPRGGWMDKSNVATNWGNATVSKMGQSGGDPLSYDSVPSLLLGGE